MGDYNYKITVEVETPEGLRKGSAVRQIKYQSTPFAIVQTGEAVMIDMPNGKTLFELMDIDTREIHFATFYWDDFTKAREKRDYKRKDFKVLLDEAKESKRRFLYPSIAHAAARNIDYPRFVYFDDELEPNSVQIVDPGDLEARFGEGYSLKQISVQMIEEPISSKIQEKLTWLKTDLLYDPIIRDDSTLDKPIYHHNFIQ
ncbi:MAG: hypothetical protein COZ43_10625 [Sphingomonadales bacterium CG_4_10_14_3_um_filter_58_15]|nr:MAG: hypothetical protein COZ43_10625 [Sphingomonadales bacterium CG_4_10_14_3_um_filter_58_15]